VVAWGLLDYNPAKRGVPNPLRHYPEKRPFESWAQIEAVANGLSAVYGPMVVFAAATGRRPSELFALEDQDVDRTGGVVFVRRAFANGRVKHTKTAASRRAVPLQAVALEALDRLPSSEGSAPVLERAGRPHRLLVVRPLRSAGVSVFAVSRFMGFSIAMIDRHYGHLARDGREHAASLLDALAIESAADAGWTPPRPRPRRLFAVT